MYLPCSDVRDVDLWTGMITERPLPGSISGATQSCIVAKHFANIKHGDRFWYENKEHGFRGGEFVTIITSLVKHHNILIMSITNVKSKVSGFT